MIIGGIDQEYARPAAFYFTEYELEYHDQTGGLRHDRMLERVLLVMVICLVMCTLLFFRAVNGRWEEGRDPFPNKV